MREAILGPSATCKRCFRFLPEWCGYSAQNWIGIGTRVIKRAALQYRYEIHYSIRSTSCADLAQRVWLNTGTSIATVSRVSVVTCPALHRHAAPPGHAPEGTAVCHSVFLLPMHHASVITASPPPRSWSACMVPCVQLQALQCATARSCCPCTLMLNP